MRMLQVVFVRITATRCGERKGAEPIHRPDYYYSAPGFSALTLSSSLHFFDAIIFSDQAMYLNVASSRRVCARSGYSPGNLLVQIR